MSDETHLHAEAAPPTPSELIRIEAQALEQLATRLDGPMADTFDTVATLIADASRSTHRIHLTGVGKSGLIARKIAATFTSTGTAAHFLHPTEALHGDIGSITHGDIVLALSYSGETEELIAIIPLLSRLGATLISFCGCIDSALAAASLHTLDVSVSREACAHQLAPTASTTAMLALGDALALDVSARLDFAPRDFADLHPGGALGRRLATVRQIMKSGAALPAVSPQTRMTETIHEMSTKRLGMTTIISGTTLLGVLSDGDLRRLLERNGPHAFHKTAAEVMNPSPRTIAPDAFATDALAIMEQNKITALVVTADGTPATQPIGVVHLHDLWEFAPKAMRDDATTPRS